jgi:selenocysteine lyase/cysteine desulfurase
MMSFDLARLRETEFPATREWRFFNHAACSPLPARAAEAMHQQIRDHAAKGNLANPIFDKTRNEARAMAARLLHAKAEEIAFVANTAEGINVVANGIRWKAGDNVVTANIEYPANMYPWLNLARHGVAVKAVAARDGRVEIDDLRRAIDSSTRVLALSWVQFASGFRADLAALGAFCRERGVLFVVDAIQGLGALPLDVVASSVDVLAAGGQKWLLGPRGCGLMYCSSETLAKLDVASVGAYSVVDEHNYLHYDLQLKPDARRFEYGTENTAGIAGLHGALELLEEVGLPRITELIFRTTEHACEAVRKKGYVVTSSRREGEWSGLVFFHKPGDDVEATASLLKERRFVLSVRNGQLRIAPHFYNTVDEVDALVEALP